MTLCPNRDVVLSSRQPRIWLAWTASPIGSRRLLVRPSNSPGTESWRDWSAKPVIRSDCNSSDLLLPATHPAPTAMKYCLKRKHPSGGSIVSAHAAVSSNPRATNAAKHWWIQNEAKWFDRNEVRSRKPRRAADVDSPIQNVPVWAAHEGGADETVDGLVAGFTKRFSRKLVQDPKGSVQSTWRYFRVASVALRQAFQK